MSEPTKENVDIRCGDLGKVFGTALILFFIVFLFIGHYEKVYCSDHAEGGFNTDIKGDWLIPQCYIELNQSGKMIPLSHYNSVEEYKQLA